MFFPAIERLGNRLLRLDPEALRRLGELRGRVIRLRLACGVESPPELYVFPDATGLRLRPHHDGVPDVTINGDLPFFSRMILGETLGRPAGELQISGDVELGRRFERILDEVDLNWEKQAARVLGDAAAHRLGNAARDLRAWGAHVAHTLGRDAAEYLQEESRILAPRARVEAFARAVAEVHDGAERAQRRLERLRGPAR